MAYLSRRRASSGSRRSFTNKNRPTNIYNVYQSGSGVRMGGGASRGTRRALIRRASGLNRGTLKNPHVRRKQFCFCLFR
jgi:hypothetical protein